MTEHRQGLPLFHTVFVICVLVAAALFGLVLWTVNGLADQVAEARGDRDALINQVEDLGAKPVVTAPPSEPGPQGEPGGVGPQGPPGRDGRDGADGSAGSPGLPGVRGQTGEQGPSGKDGEPGQNGADGQQGTPGADGQDGVDGVDGQDGAPGRDGQDGADGAPGPPPSSWTYTDQLGTTYRCTDPDGDLAYTCEPVDQAPPIGG